ncbi:MAG: lysozyme inhibitor LprI family protein [Flavobacterium sp.]
MKSILLVLFFFYNILMFSQTESQNNKYDFDKKCGDGNQQSINICLSNAITKLSEVMDKKYNYIVAYLNTQIKSYTGDKEIQAAYIKMKANLVTSQATWRKLKDQNAEFYSGGGGTETPMLIGQSIIKDYKDRLIWLDNLIEEEGQGNETKILKSE